MFAILAVDWWSLHAVSDLSHGTPALHDGWIVSPDTATIDWHIAMTLITHCM